MRAAEHAAGPKAAPEEGAANPKKRGREVARGAFPKATKVRRSRGLFSRFGGALLIGNTLAAILVVFAGLGLTAYRDGLIEARLETIERQASLARAALSSEALGICGDGSCVGDPITATLVLTEAAKGFDGRLSYYVLEGGKLRQVAESGSAAEARPAAVPIPSAMPEGSLVSRGRELASGLLGRLLFELPLKDRISPLPPETDALRILRAESEGGTRLRYRPGGALHAAAALPLVQDGEVRSLIIAESTDVEAVSASLGRLLLPLLLAVFALSSFSAVTLTAAVTQPLRQLAQAADKVRSCVGRAGQVKLPNLDHRQDEVGRLSRSFRAMTEALTQRIESIDDFAADVSHELKNPLTSIRSAVETFEKCKTDEQKARLFRVIASDVERMDRLISDIAGASRLDAQLATEKRTTLSASKLAGDVAGSYGAVTKAGGPRVNFWDDTDGKLKLYGAPSALGRVIRNLVDNAVSFSPPTGAVTVALEKPSRQGGALVITVTDEGPGVPEENLESVFDRFYTQRGSGESFGANSGLGLAIARQICESHGGRIWCENMPPHDPQFSDQPGGARFVVELPVHRGAPS
jgi:two-component system sensor histidine kinase ChvG